MSDDQPSRVPDADQVERFAKLIADPAARLFVHRDTESHHFGLESKAAIVARLRADPTASLRTLEKQYADLLAFLEAAKARGTLTRDWGECSLSCVRQTLKDIRTAITVALAGTG